MSTKDVSPQFSLTGKVYIGPSPEGRNTMIYVDKIVTLYGSDDSIVVYIDVSGKYYAIPLNEFQSKFNVRC